MWSIIISLTCTLFAATKPEEGAHSALPPVWHKVSAQQRLNALRIAELDATRLLAERIFGIQVEGDSTVRDLARLDDRLKGGAAAGDAGCGDHRRPHLSA